MTDTTKATKAASVASARRSRWAKHLEEWQRSRQSQRAFCAERSLSLSSFRWWRARLHSSEARSPRALFLPITLGTEQSGSAALIEVELRSGARLRLSGEAALRAVDRLVERIR